jgi:serine/threonine protein kinase
MNDQSDGQLPQVGVTSRQEVFSLPSVGERIISPLTGCCYVMGAPCGRGAFGEVFACQDEWEHELVAKVIKPMDDQRLTEERAVREIAALALVRSPHIVHVHDAFTYRGAHYIIAERCGLTLRGMMAGEDFKAWIWYPALVKGILHALHFVHMQGLVHCDLHAGNVFLRIIPDSIIPQDQSACVFKLGDFGLARPIETMDPSGTFMTTLCPPEALNPSEFGPLDHRADIYQAGLLFLSVLFGRELVFTTEEILAGRPRELAEALPGPSASAIAKMLRRHSTARQETALDAWREICDTLRTQ